MPSYLPIPAYDAFQAETDRAQQEGEFQDQRQAIIKQYFPEGIAPVAEPPPAEAPVNRASDLGWEQQPPAYPPESGTEVAAPSSPPAGPPAEQPSPPLAGPSVPLSPPPDTGFASTVSRETKAAAFSQAETPGPIRTDDWVGAAKSQLNKPYIWGSAGGRTDFSKDAAGFDCSGFVAYVLKNGMGIDLPAFTGTAYGKTAAVSAKDAQPGDVVFYNMNNPDPAIQHMALYLGNGQIIQAGGTQRSVNIADVNALGGAEFRRPAGYGAAQAVSQVSRGFQDALGTTVRAVGDVVGPLAEGAQDMAAQYRAKRQEIIDSVLGGAGAVKDTAEQTFQQARQKIIDAAMNPVEPSTSGLFTEQDRLKAGIDSGELKPTEKPSKTLGDTGIGQVPWLEVGGDAQTGTGGQPLTLAGPLGMMADVATDPTTYLLGGPVLGAGGAVQKAVAGALAKEVTEGRILPEAAKSALPWVYRQVTEGGIWGAIQGAQDPEKTLESFVQSVMMGAATQTALVGALKGAGQAVKGVKATFPEGAATKLPAEADPTFASGGLAGKGAGIDRNQPDLFGGEGIKRPEMSSDPRVNAAAAKQEMMDTGSKNLFDAEQPGPALVKAPLEDAIPDTPYFRQGGETQRGRMVPVTDETVLEDWNALRSRHLALEESTPQMEARLADWPAAGEGGVYRPPWHAGRTEQELIEIARENGASAFQEGWWQGINLTHDTRTITATGKKVRVGTGEFKENVQQRASATPDLVTKASLQREIAAAKAEMADLERRADAFAEALDSGQPLYRLENPYTTDLPWDTGVLPPEPTAVRTQAPSPPQLVRTPPPTAQPVDLASKGAMAEAKRTKTAERKLAADTLKFNKLNRGAGGPPKEPPRPTTVAPSGDEGPIRPDTMAKIRAEWADMKGRPVLFNADDSVTLKGAGRVYINDLPESMQSEILTRHAEYRAQRNPIGDAQLAEMAKKLDMTPEELARARIARPLGQDSAEDYAIRSAAKANDNALADVRLKLKAEHDPVTLADLAAKEQQLSENAGLYWLAVEGTGSDRGRALGLMSRAIDAKTSADTVTQWRKLSELTSAVRAGLEQTGRTGTLSAKTARQLQSIKTALEREIALPREATTRTPGATRAPTGIQPGAEAVTAGVPLRRTSGTSTRTAARTTGEGGGTTPPPVKLPDELVAKAAELARLTHEMPIGVTDNATFVQTRVLRQEIEDGVLSRLKAEAEARIAAGPKYPGMIDDMYTRMGKGYIAALREKLKLSVEPVEQATLIVGSVKDKAARRMQADKLFADLERDIQNSIRKEMVKAQQVEAKGAAAMAKQAIRDVERLDLAEAKAQVKAIDTLLQADDSMAMRQYAQQLLADMREVSKQSAGVADAYQANINKKAVRGLLTDAQKKESPEARQFYLARLAKEFGAVDWTNSREAAKFAETFADKPTTWIKLHTYRVASMLSGATGIINVAGSLAETLYAPAVRTAARPSRLGLTQAGDEVVGYMGAFPGAWHDAVKTFTTGVSSRPVRELNRQVTDVFKTGGGYNPVNALFRTFSATDDFFRFINKAGALRAEARVVAQKTGESTDDIILNLVKHPEVAKRAGQLGEQRTYNAKLTGIAGWLGEGRQKYPVIQAVVPFYNTLANMATKNTQRIGGGFLEARKLEKLGEHEAAVYAVGEARLGAAAMLFFGLQTANGNITGYGPHDPQERKDWIEQGNQPWSVKIGGQWRSYRQFGAFVAPIGLAASLVENAKKLSTPQQENIIKEFVEDQSKMWLDIVGLRGIDDVLSAMTGDPGAWDRLAESVGPTLLPAVGATGAVARARDTGVKDTETWQDVVMSRLPFLSEQVPNQQTQFGEDRRRGQSWLPIATSDIKPDSVLQEYQRLRALGAKVGVGMTGDSVGGLKLNRGQQRDYQAFVGPIIRQELEKLIASKQYQTASPDIQVEMLEIKERQVRHPTVREARTLNVPSQFLKRLPVETIRQGLKDQAPKPLQAPQPALAR